MIIDVHGHVSAPPALSSYQGGLISSRGAHGKGGVGATVETVRESHLRPLPNWDNLSHIGHIDLAGINAQLISPRPFTLMHSEEPESIVRWFCEETNDIIKLACDAFPDRFKGICGLPQSKDTTPADWIGELRRCVTELGMVGAMINPDPMEGKFPPLPALGQKWWYPIYEVACELDVPLLVHPASCMPPARENYSLHFITKRVHGLP
jgi:predicted TIM-barrel fold metal-dependent hydrolase